MKIACIAMVRNEADIVETFVRHHLEIADTMVVVDHASNDGTPAVLAALEAECPRLTVLCERGQALDQTLVTTRRMRAAARDLGADWILPLDADEFLVAGTKEARTAIEALPADRYHRIPMRTYVPRPDDPGDAPTVLDRIQYRRLTELSVKYKIIVPGALAALRDVEVKVGNHALRRRRMFWSRTLPSADAEKLFIAHFPVRSTEQIMGKVILGWLARCASPEQKGTRNWHLRELFEKFRSGALPSPADLMEMALDYAVTEELRGHDRSLVRDPVRKAKKRLVLQHPDSYRLDLFAGLLGFAEDAAVELGRLRRKTTVRRRSCKSE